MPVSAVFFLRPVRRATVPAAPGRSLYAAVLRATALADPAAAAGLHDDEGPSPLTISALSGPGDRRGGRLALDPERPCWIRISSLDDARIAPVLAGLGPGGPRLVLDGAELEVTDVHLDPEAHPAAGRLSLDALAEVAPVARQVTLRFDSPTLLRGTPRDVPFPLPEAVFGSVVRRLERVPGGPPLATGARLTAELEAHVEVGRYELETKVFRGGRQAPLVGFVGQVRYRVLPGASAALRRDLAIVATAARYAGVGAKVTWGMGQCRRTNEGPTS